MRPCFHVRVFDEKIFRADVILAGEKVFMYRYDGFAIVQKLAALLQGAILRPEQMILIY